MSKVFIAGREVVDIEVDGVDTSDYPDFSDAFFYNAVWADTGENLDDDDLATLQEQESDLLYEMAMEKCQSYE
jgi:hypothetical protein